VVDGIIKPVLLGAVREALGPDVPLMLDPFHYYSRLEALDLAKGLERLGFPWMEEPMDEHSMSSYVWLHVSQLPGLGMDMNLNYIRDNLVRT